MELPIEALAAGGSLIVSIVVTGIAYGVVREKVAQLEERVATAIQESKTDRKDIREEQKGFVTYNHLDAVVEPLQSAINTIEADVKEILRAVSKRP